MPRFPLLPDPTDPPASLALARARAITNHRQAGNEITYYWFYPFWTLAWFLSIQYDAKTGSLADWQRLGASPDIIIVIDLPRQKKVFDELRASYPRSSFILVIAETPLERHIQHDERNFRFFDAVITYDRSSKASYSSVYFYNLPFSFYRHSGDSEISGSELKRANFCTFVGNPHTAGWRRNIQYELGLKGLPVLWQYQSGWAAPVNSAVLDEMHNGYQKRNKLLRIASKSMGQQLLIHGKGWENIDSGWTRKLPRLRSMLSLSGMPVGIQLGNKDAILRSSLFCLACENYTGNKYYLSEKVFDAMAAGCIPIYLGHPNALPAEVRNCIVDISHIPLRKRSGEGSLVSLFDELQRMSIEEISRRRSGCLAYIKSKYETDYGHHQFFEAVSAALHEIIDS